MVNVVIAESRMGVGARPSIAIYINALGGVIAEAAFIDGNRIGLAGISDGDAGGRIRHITAAECADVGTVAGIDGDTVPETWRRSNAGEGDAIVGIVAVCGNFAIDNYSCT